MSMTQLNTRIDSRLKASGDAVFERFGYSPSQAVRALWDYASRQQGVPEFMDAKSASQAAETPGNAAMRGFGLAGRLAQERGIGLSVQAPYDFAALEDEVYDGLLDDYEANHV